MNQTILTVKLHTLVAALAVLALLAATAPLASTQAAEIGEGVEIRAADTPNADYVQVGDDGQVSIQLDADAAVPGEGLPADTLARFDNVIVAVNTNTASNAEGRQAYVYVTGEGTAADDFAFYRGASDIEDSDPGTSIEGEANAVRLDTGESTVIGFAVDTRDEFTANDVTFTVNADVSQIADAVLAIETGVPTAGEPVTFNATASEGDAITYAYDFDDGTVTNNVDPREAHAFADPGTYNVTLTVDETAARAPNGSDSVTRQVVVSGPPQTAPPGETVTLPNAVSGSDDPSIESVTVDLAGGASDDVTVRALATESVANVAGGNSPQGSSVVGAANVSVPTTPNADATVTVELDASAVPADVAPSDLALERYDGTTWQVLPTTVQSTGGGTITLVAETPGFSPFAATVNPGAPTLDLGGGGGGGGGGDVDLGDGDDADDSGDDDEGTDGPDAPDDVDDGVDDPVDDADDDPAVDDGGTPDDADGTDGVAPPDDQPPDGELGGISLLPTLGIAAVLAILAAVAFIRIRRRE
ncbi:PKD domain-containing protein [Halorubrum sp. GN11_10-6_MGM]|uniref:PKD domain-containing protein n=1 Tax=Halorubrum sp. GN11_10-6_MGM TaxID=2518112 RepID=UPI0010F9C671|nr:PKD domain-containing protein [Halorubrum sp. GN11_10-6_MGM]TKX72913.1 PKD domain-containing protein [Halorubrum sp. GN11_10-6_MGM]